MGKKKTDSKPASFESSLDDLKAIVSDLETGNLSLDQSLEKYELAVKHLKHCYKALKSAERKIEVLVDLDENGELTTLPFEDQATEFGSQDRRESGRNEETTDMDDHNSLF